MAKLKNENFLYIGLFVLLWGSAAIFTKWGLHHGAAIPFLFFRFLIATALILFFCAISKQPFYPQNTSFKYVILTGCFEPYRVCRRPLFLRECPDEKSKIHP
ncbi:DMT family transporter [Acinetobacter colistiniresistens]|uniref:DMT family transporter n=1 Tax=Acinetobacter colistiniresistens TaxID=280145 RepID=UPI002FE0D6F6